MNTGLHNPPNFKNEFKMRREFIFCLESLFFSSVTSLPSNVCSSCVFFSFGLKTDLVIGDKNLLVCKPETQNSFYSFRNPLFLPHFSKLDSLITAKWVTRLEVSSAPFIDLCPFVCSWTFFKTDPTPQKKKQSNNNFRWQNIELGVVMSDYKIWKT